MRNRIKFKDRCGGAIIEWNGKTYLRIMRGMKFRECHQMQFTSTTRRPFCKEIPKAPANFDYPINTDYDGDCLSTTTREDTPKA